MACKSCAITTNLSNIAIFLRYTLCTYINTCIAIERWWRCMCACVALSVHWYYCALALFRPFHCVCARTHSQSMDLHISGESRRNQVIH